jgi:DNA-binding PadR family transcriptional regulator
MPLAHAILGFLDYQPMSGYDIKKAIDLSVSHFWSATQSHIYKALENLEKEGMVESLVIQQEGKPNRKQYQITDAGRAELRHWASTPLPIEGPRQAWLIQVFFAHRLANEEIVHLFEKRIEELHVYLSKCEISQSKIDERYKQFGVKRVRDLWQMTLDNGISYYENEIAWLEKQLPLIRKLPPLSPSKK